MYKVIDGKVYLDVQEYLEAAYSKVFCKGGNEMNLDEAVKQMKDSYSQVFCTSATREIERKLARLGLNSQYGISPSVNANAYDKALFKFYSKESEEIADFVKKLRDGHVICDRVNQVKAAGSFEEATAIMDKYFKEETEIDRLEAQLKAYGIEYEKCRLNGGWQICVPSREFKEWDVVCHSFSYGHETGLLELMGDSMLTYDELQYDTVVGYLEAEEVIYRYYHREQFAREKQEHKELLNWWNDLDLAEQEELKKHWDRVVTGIENRRE